MMFDLAIYKMYGDSLRIYIFLSLAALTETVEPVCNTLSLASFSKLPGVVSVWRQAIAPLLAFFGQSPN